MHSEEVQKLKTEIRVWARVNKKDPNGAKVIEKVRSILVEEI